MKALTIILKIIRKLYRLVNKNDFSSLKSLEISREKANEIIYSLLIDSFPIMISRFGTTELITLNNYLTIISNDNVFKKILKYISDNTHLPWWQTENFKYLSVYSGVFPPNKQTAIQFSQRYIQDVPMIDILGSFQYYEKFIPLKKDIIRTHLETLYPFFVSNPWTIYLKNEKVLVIHPFKSTIQFQYQRRKLLFENSNILPDFNLITMKPVQSAADMECGFKNWSEALQYMEVQISKIDFDICLLGCGAYGLPLAAFIKNKLNKNAIHLGGGLQLLFGIKGKRWDDPDYGKKQYSKYAGLMNVPYSSLYNEYWIRPLKEDTPKEAHKIDNATYW